MKFSVWLLTGLLFIWSAFVLQQSYNWIRIPKLGLAWQNSTSTIFALFILLTLYVLAFLAHSISQKQIKLHFVTVWQLGILFLASLTIFLVAKAFVLNLITPWQIPLALVHILVKEAGIILALFICVAVLYAFGSRIIGKMFNFANNATAAMTYLATGFIIFTSVLFGLSLVGWLRAPLILVLFLLFLIVSKPKLNDFQRIFNFPLQIPKSIFERVILTLILLQLLFSVANVMSPIPTGYDSLSYYFKLAKELASTGSIVAGQYAMPIELFYSALLSVSDWLGYSNWAESIAMHWAVVWGFIGCLPIYLLARKVTRKSVALAGVAIYYTMPLIGFFNSYEPKPDMYLVPFMGLALLLLASFWEQLNFRINLLISTILFYSFTIKPTALLGIIPFFAVLFLLQLLRKKFITAAYILVASLIAIILIVMPWLALHVWEKQIPVRTAINRVRQGDLYGSVLAGQNNYQIEWYKLYLKTIGTTFTQTGYTEDYGRYQLPQVQEKGNFMSSLFNMPVLNYLRVPWHITILDLVASIHFMISPLYYILLAFLPWLLFRKRKLLVPYFAHWEGFISLFALFYYILWIRKGQGVVWYGIGLFVPFTLFVAYIWEQLTQIMPKIGKLWLKFLVIGTVCVGLLIQSDRLSNQYTLAYATGLISKDQAVSKLTKGYIAYANIINADPQVGPEGKKVIISGSYLHYFLDDYYSAVINDLWIDNLAAIVDSGRGDLDQSLANFQALGIKYIIFNLGTQSLDETLGETLVKKHELFMQFATRKLVLRDFNKEAGILLLEVPY